MNKTLLASSVALAMTAGISSNANAVLASNAVLDFSDGVGSCQAGGTFPVCEYGATTVVVGSYFAMDVAGGGDGTLGENERVAISSAGGVTLGTPQARGTVDQVWSFGGSPGEHYTLGDDGLDANGVSVASASGNTASIDMSGWTVWWGDATAEPPEDGPINMGAGANATLTCDVDCAVGDNFSLDYTAVVPTGGFTGVLYGLHLEGVIAAVPVPAAVWLFGSGLLGLVGVARRRKTA